jgi:hypothetical protein
MILSSDDFCLHNFDAILFWNLVLKLRRFFIRRKAYSNKAAKIKSNDTKTYTPSAVS